MKKILVSVALLAISGCATMTEQDGGLVEDHANTVNKCGVGNYAFRHLKGKCGESEVVTTPALAPAPAAPAAAPKAAEHQSVAKLVDNKIEISQEIQFQTGKSTLTPAGKSVLDAVAQEIKNNEAKISSIEIAGHTDHVGNAAKNQSLSQKRADAVRTYLAGKGVSPKMLNAKGYGSSMPKVDPKGASKEEWSKNRRVEFNAVIR